MKDIPTFSYGFSPKGQPAGQANTGQGSALCKGENPYENVGNYTTADKIYILQFTYGQTLL